MHRPSRRALPALLVAACGLLSAAAAHAQRASDGHWDFGMVLDGAYSSRALEAGARDKGAALGHSDLTARGPLGAHLSAEANVAFHTDGGKLEHHVEGAWLQTRTLPLGLQARAGRFASQVGYLNEVHPHADDFVERPLLYRAFLGGHWIDDGVRLNWTAPTPFYLRLGAEAFTGRRLVTQTAAGSRSGAMTLNLKTGGDLGASQSWQWGLSHLQNRRQSDVDAEPEEHEALFSGRRMWVSDLVWKWAPEGNNRNQQLRVVWEVARIGRIQPGADTALSHHASTLAIVWRFDAAWEAGLRTDRLRVNKPESDGGSTVFSAGRLNEAALMLAYRPTHGQTVRLQLARQSAGGTGVGGDAIFASPARRSLQLQYVIAFGAHGAHAF